MGLKIAQDFTYEGDDWWKWWIWIDGTETELDRISEVIYTLHPTFPDPVRTVRDRSTKFRLETAGWGTFRILAKVVPKSGKPIVLQHDLVLNYPGGEPAVA